MEVPRRPQPASFTLAHPKHALSPLGAVQKVAQKDPMSEILQERNEGTDENDRFGEEVFGSEEGSADTSENGGSNASTVDSRLSSQDSFSEDSSMSEERLAQEAEEARRKSEEEEAAAKERAAQRQGMAIEELVQSERNYLRLLQVSTVTIRNGLQNLQVGCYGNSC